MTLCCIPAEGFHHRRDVRPDRDRHLATCPLLDPAGDVDARLARPVHQGNEMRARDAKLSSPLSHGASGPVGNVFGQGAHAPSMSHIATSRSSPSCDDCRHCGQAFTVARFYTQPMALRIRQLREAKGWTQLHLAELAGMSRSQLAMIEKETRPANTLRLNAIAKALGVPTEHLFESSSDETRVLTILRDLSPEDRLNLVRIAESLAAKNEQG